MKRFWLILLSLGLITAFSTSAMGVDVKFSGEYFAAGMYLDKLSLVKSSTSSPAESNGLSTAFYYQRLRLKTDIIVAKGLIFTTRADIMDRQWGATRSAATSATYSTATGTGVVTTVSASTVYDSAGTRAENENIVFDWAYLTYISPIGLFQVGYMDDYVWGTVFGDRSKPNPAIKWLARWNNLTVGLGTIKETEKSYSAINTAGASDADLNVYGAFLMYTFKFGEVGYLFRNHYIATLKPTYGVKATTYINIPYVKVKMGPVAVEAEVNYTFGRYDWEGTQLLPMNKIDSWSAYVNAVADFGPFYLGGTFAWLPGNDPNSDRVTGALTGGTDWNPCLILWNNERSYQAGSITGASGSVNNTDGTTSTGMANAWFFQGKAGVRPVDKLNISASVSYANAVVKPTNAWLYNAYGWEVDATATYKITNNLSYMLGVGYLFTGDYFKGTDNGVSLHNDYLVVNKLTLTF